MAIENYSGIIIKIRDFMEMDKIVTILTNHGKIMEGIAKGARNIKSRKSPNIELLNKIKFSMTGGKSLNIIIEITPIDSTYKNIQPEFINFIFYFSEVTYKFIEQTGEYKDANFLFELRDNLHVFPFHSILSLQLLMMQEMGSLPDLMKCGETGEGLEEQRFAHAGKIGYFSYEGFSKQPTMSDRILKIQQFLLKNNFENITKLNITEEDFNQLVALQNDWLECIIEQTIKSYKLLFI